MICAADVSPLVVPGVVKSYEASAEFQLLEIDGETVTEARCGIGYLHTGIEKNMEFRSWVQGVTFVTRMDYLTPMFNETAYCMSVEKLLGITDEIPERAKVIRVLMMELCRIQSQDRKSVV